MKISIKYYVVVLALNVVIFTRPSHSVITVTENNSINSHVIVIIANNLKLRNNVSL